MRKNNRGFTMIELLVVLAIAAIIAAIALPSYANINDNIEDTKRKDYARAIANAINFELTAANTDKLRKNEIEKELQNGTVIIKKDGDLNLAGNLAKVIFNKIEASSSLSDEILDGYFMVNLKKDSGSILVQECYFTTDKAVAEKLFKTSSGVYNTPMLTKSEIAVNKLGVYTR